MARCKNVAGSSQPSPDTANITIFENEAAEERFGLPQEVYDVIVHHGWEKFAKHPDEKELQKKSINVTLVTEFYAHFTDPNQDMSWQYNPHQDHSNYLEETFQAFMARPDSLMEFNQLPQQCSNIQEPSNSMDAILARMDVHLREAEEISRRSTNAMDTMSQQLIHRDTEIPMLEVKEQCEENSVICEEQLEPLIQKHVDEKCPNEPIQQIATATVEELGQSNATTTLNEAEKGDASANSKESDAKNATTTLMRKHESLNCSYPQLPWQSHDFMLDKQDGNTLLMEYDKLPTKGYGCLGDDTQSMVIPLDISATSKSLLMEIIEKFEENGGWMSEEFKTYSPSLDLNRFLVEDCHGNWLEQQLPRQRRLHPTMLEVDDNESERVEFTAKAINKFFVVKRTADLHPPFVNSMKDQNIDFLLENLCFQGAEWDEANTMVERDRLKPAAKLWMHFLKINLMPTTHTATVNLPRLQLLHSILNYRSINLGQLIIDEAFAGISRKESPLLFPRLITALCLQKGVMEDENDFYIRGRQGIKPTQIPCLMGFDEDAIAKAPPRGARTIAAARLAELMALTEKMQERMRDMQEMITSLFHYMRERDEAIQSYFLELLPDEVPLFPIFPNELFHSAQPTKQRAPQEQSTPQPPPGKKNAASTSTTTPQT
ncbi:hypothetical protein GQ457_04G022890 [Hibiscus cannabinus]